MAHAQIDDYCQQVAEGGMDEKGFLPNEVRDKVLNALKIQPANRVCFDCPARNPSWVSLPFGVFMCLDCSGEHRRMGTHITFVRSASMDGFYPGQLVGMIMGGNAKVMAELKKFGITAKRKSDAGNKVDFSGVQMKKLYQKMLKDTEAKCNDFGIQMYQLGGVGSAPIIPGQTTQANFCKPEVKRQSNPAPNFSSAPEAASTAAPAQITFDAPVEKKGPGLVVKKNTNVPKFSAAAGTKAPLAKPKIVAGGLDDDFDDWFNELDNVEAKKKEDDAKQATAAKAAAVKPDLASAVAAAKPVVKTQEPLTSTAPATVASGYSTAAPASSPPVKKFGMFTQNNQAPVSATFQQQSTQHQVKTIKSSGFGSDDMFQDSQQSKQEHAARMQSLQGRNAIGSDMYFGRQESIGSTASWGDTDWADKKQEAIDKGKEIASAAYDKGNALFEKYFR